MPSFTLPELGENITSGTVSRVLVSVGDTIDVDQPVVELETDKATVEVPTSIAGTISGIAVKAGDTVKVGAIVLTVGGGDDAAAGSGKRKSPRGSATDDQVEKDAEAPERGAGPPRTSAPRTARAAEADAGDDESGSDGSDADRPRSQGDGKVIAMSRSSRSEAQAPGPAPASPAVRRLAREIGVDIDAVRGSGPGGRISTEDVKQYSQRVLASLGSPRSAGGASPVGLPDFSRWGEVERQPMSGVRRKTAEHLSHAWTAIPHVTQVEKADVTDLEALRTRHAAAVEARGGKLTMTAILVKVLAAAVKEFAQFGASVDMEAQELVLKRYVHVGVAVDTDRGLLVPVVRDADRKGLVEIAVEVQALAEKARARKLTLDDMSGGTITVSNLGGIGGTHFTPIVNWPEVAILGVSRGRREPVYRGDTLEPRLMLPLSLSYDHRVIDGADAMRFLRWVADALEQPFQLAL
ncbi:MAG: branched-chain alpha-keto acid dehydrogenase subunit E2 [Acidimicrobiia bacterium]|nr:branched-chain alpha-keto acid dehydrogenase subunit E2 [Acidimicrobiia bacterium]